jgi:regulatory subunit for Cdc7p protein kinase
MKIWALEKLQRMMTTMFDTEIGLQTAHSHNTRSNAAQGTISTVSRSGREADLSALLRNERINGPSDRDPTVATKEMILFKGPFIYVHDIDEKQRPIMVREYAKVSNKEQGDWPQFRSVAHGKCPFVPDVDYGRRDAERDMLRQQRQYEKERSAAPRTRAAAAVEAHMQPPTASNKRALLETESAANRNSVSASTKQQKLFSQPQSLSQSLDEEPSSKGPQNAFVSRAGVGRLFGGEPVASGLQQSNITSAIRSQMISSTSAAPGARAGTSKEVHGLQRKVLEKNSGPASLGLTSSHRMTDLGVAAKEETGNRISKRKAQGNLGLIEEDTCNNENEDTARRTEETRVVKALPKRKAVKRDPKPGYCENCMDKFDDFEEVCCALCTLYESD